MVTLFHGANNAAQTSGQANISMYMSIFYMVAAVIILFMAKPAP